MERGEASSTPHMSNPRRRLPGFDYSNPRVTYFLTMCTPNRDGRFLDPALCSIVLESLQWMRANRGVSIYAYCLMPDHLHLLAQLRDDEVSLGATIGALKRHTNRQGQIVTGRGDLWQARFYDHVLREDEDLGAIVEYILDNPVRKGLASRAAEYPYSGMPDPL